MDLFTKLKMKLTPEKVKELESLYVNLTLLNENIQKKIDNDEISKNDAFDYMKKVQTIEFELQLMYGFNLDERYHSWWFRSPPCTCPKLDNMERVGIDQRVYSDSCPIHKYL